MIELAGLISTAIGGYQWLRAWHEKQTNPPHLPEHAIIVFKRFKEAYDRKSVGGLSNAISDGYVGDIYGVRRKPELLQALRSVFRFLPWGMHPCLAVNVYSIVEDSSKKFQAIINTRSIITVLGIPLRTHDSATVRCTIVPEGRYGVWSVSEVFIHPCL